MTLRWWLKALQDWWWIFMYSHHARKYYSSDPSAYRLNKMNHYEVKSRARLKVLESDLDKHKVQRIARKEGL